MPANRNTQIAYQLIYFLGAGLALRLLVTELRYRRTLRLHMTPGASRLFRTPRYVLQNLGRQHRQLDEDTNWGYARAQVMDMGNQQLQMVSLIVLGILLTWRRSRRLVADFGMATGLYYMAPELDVGVRLRGL